MWCTNENCEKGPIKPDIVFFGESLPSEFHMKMMNLQVEKPDLMLIMGTALAVAPFNMMPYFVGESVPKVLFNMENTNKTSAYDFCDGLG